MPGRLDEMPEGLGRLGVDDPPPATKKGPLCAPQDLRRRGRAQPESAAGRGTCHVRRLEQLLRPVVGLGLHVLGQADRHRPRSGGIGEDPHGSEERVRELLRSLHPVEKARHGTKGVVHRHVASVELLELLKHRVTARVAKTSEGRSRTGIRLTVAVAAPVTILVAPGPTDERQAKVDRRLRMRAKPQAVCTIACSLRAW